MQKNHAPVSKSSFIVYIHEFMSRLSCLIKIFMYQTHHHSSILNFPAFTFQRAGKIYRSDQLQSQSCILAHWLPKLKIDFFQISLFKLQVGFWQNFTGLISADPSCTCCQYVLLLCTKWSSELKIILGIIHGAISTISCILRTKKCIDIGKMWENLTPHSNNLC